MVTVLFAHDGYMSISKEGIYSDTYDNRIVERYLKIAENVVFMVRTRIYTDHDKRLNQITIANFRVSGIENFKSIKGILNYRNLIEKVKDEVYNADYIVARIPSDLGFIAAEYAKKYNKKCMIEVVGCPWDSLRSHSFLGKLIAPYYYLRQKKTVWQASYAIYVTNEFLQKRYPCKGISIGCSDVEINDFDATVIARRKEKISKADLRSLVLGTIGALHMKYKGYDRVIKAISKLNGEGYSYKYLIAGNGDSTWLNSIIHKYNANNFVVIVPPMSHEQVFDWLDNIDLYIQPSKTEGMPRALIEAMSRGLPSVGTKVGGITELLEGRYTFSNSRFSIIEICRILKSYTKEDMKNQANRNYIESQRYNMNIVESLRNEFYKGFY